MLALLACVPLLYPDPWTHTYALCGDAPWAGEVETSAECRAALLDDAHTEDDPTPATDGLVRGLRWLLGSDYGDTVEADDWIDPAFVASLDAARVSIPGDGPNAQVLYDFVVERIERVEVDRDGLVAMGWDGTLYIADYLDEGEDAYAAATLVHEARHRDGHAQDHVPCPGDEPDAPAGCDDDPAGANGYAVATLTLNLRAQPSWEEDCPARTPEDDRREDELLRRSDVWRGRILTDLPPADRERCGA